MKEIVEIVGEFRMTRCELRENVELPYRHDLHRLHDHPKLSALGLDWEDNADAIEIEGASGLVDEPLLLDCAEASVRGVGLLGE